MNKTLKVVLVIVGVWGVMGLLGSWANSRTYTGLSQEQKDEAKIQLGIETCLDEFNRTSVGNNYSINGRQYCGCVMNKVADSVGIDALYVYGEDDVDKVIEDFYPEIKACVNQQLSESEQI